MYITDSFAELYVYLYLYIYLVHLLNAFVFTQTSGQLLPDGLLFIRFVYLEKSPQTGRLLLQLIFESVYIMGYLSRCFSNKAFAGRSMSDKAS